MLVVILHFIPRKQVIIEGDAAFAPTNTSSVSRRSKSPRGAILGVRRRLLLSCFDVIVVGVPVLAGVLPRRVAISYW